MNKNPEIVSTLNQTEFFLEYPCKTGNELCTSISKLDNNVQLVFSNGNLLTLNFKNFHSIDIG